MCHKSPNQWQALSTVCLVLRVNCSVRSISINKPGLGVYSHYYSTVLTPGRDCKKRETDSSRLKQLVCGKCWSRMNFEYLANDHYVVILWMGHPNEWVDNVWIETYVPDMIVLKTDHTMCEYDVWSIQVTVVGMNSYLPASPIPSNTAIHVNKVHWSEHLSMVNPSNDRYATDTAVPPTMNIFQGPNLRVWNPQFI